MEPSVSVVLPAYNAGQRLQTAAGSILNQSLRGIELILVDDGSTDGSVDRFLATPSADDGRLRVIRQENRGLAAALNVGIAEARSAYIARMDADDVSHIDRLVRQIAVLDGSRETVLVGGQVRRVANGRTLSTTRFPTEHDAIVAGLLSRAHVLSHPTVVFRAADAKLVGGYWANGVSEDWDLFLRLSERGKLANLSSPVLDYSYDSDSINATQLVAVRINMRLAIANYHRRRLAQPELTPSQLIESMTLLDRAGLAMEQRSLTHYRQCIQARSQGRPVRALAHLAASASWWPQQALRRLHAGP